MVVNQNNEGPKIKIFINENKPKQTDQFKYLCTLISSDGRNNTEIASRIVETKKSFQRMKSTLTNNPFSIHTQRALIYGYEALIV